jgi:hypothetical protein
MSRSLSGGRGSGDAAAGGDGGGGLLFSMGCLDLLLARAGATSGFASPPLETPDRVACPRVQEAGGRADRLPDRVSIASLAGSFDAAPFFRLGQTDHLQPA